MCGFPILSSWLHSGVWYKTPTKRFPWEFFCVFEGSPFSSVDSFGGSVSVWLLRFLFACFRLLGYPVAVLLKSCSWKISFFSLGCLRLYCNLLSAAGLMFAGVFSGSVRTFSSLRVSSSLDLHWLSFCLGVWSLASPGHWIADVHPCFVNQLSVVILIQFSGDLGFQTRWL